MQRENIGPNAQGVKVGDTFTTRASDDWAIGDEMVTWANLHVKITEKQPSNEWGSWKYVYKAEVLKLSAPGRKE